MFDFLSNPKVQEFISNPATMQMAASLLSAPRDQRFSQSLGNGLLAYQQGVAAQQELALKQERARQEQLRQQQEQAYKQMQIDKMQWEMNQPKDRKIVTQNGINYYADTQEPVLPTVPGKEEKTDVNPYKFDPSDYTVDSFNEFIRTGDASKLIRYQAPTKPEGPLSPEGKLRSDLVNGLITQDQYNASIEKAKEKNKKEYTEIRLDDGTIVTSGSNQLPAAKVELLSEGRQLSLVTAPLQKLVETWEFGPIAGRTRGANPYDKIAQKADSDIRRAAQMIGKFMEGGVLRKEDEEKYRKMLPNITDTKDVASYKLQSINDLLSQKYLEYLQDFGAAGYDVANFTKVINKKKKPEGVTLGRSTGADGNFTNTYGQFNTGVSQEAQDYLKSIGYAEN